MKQVLFATLMIAILSASVYGAVELTDPDSLNALGYYLYQDGRFDVARGAFERALYFEPGFEEARSNLAILLFEMQEYKAAETELEILVEKNENNAQYWYDLGATRIANFRYGTSELEDFYEGLAAYEQAAELNPSYAHVQENLAVLYRIKAEFGL